MVREIAERRELLLILVSRNLKIRYKHSTLGFFWSLLGPLFLILIYATFASILRFNQGRPGYLQFLVVGIVSWQFLVMCLNDSLYAIMGNANLVKRTAFPRAILPLAMVTANLVNFLLTGVVLFAYLLIVRADFGPLLLLPAVLATHVALCLGLALAMSTANVFFRDTEHILSVVTLAWFFLTPIFYPVGMQLEKLAALPGWVGNLVFLNPMTGLVCAYRAILISGETPPMALMGISFAVCWIVLLIGVVVFRRFEWRFGDEL